MAPSPRGLLVPSKKLRVLDFDIETRLVGFYEAGRLKPNGSEPTAIAASWVGNDDIHVWAQPDLTVDQMLRRFRGLYNSADIVTGHYIRKFDLPILNGAMIEHGMALLDPMKLVSDTKVDLKPFEGLSKSQENLSELLLVYEDKYQMNDVMWREATRLTPVGVTNILVRVMQDIRQHKELRAALLAAGALNPPTIWRP
jgi:hypothetical protein